MKKIYRTQTCGDASSKQIGTKVILSGWVHRIRNLGAMVFIDLRDRFGITQVVFDEAKTVPEIFEKIQALHHEDVVRIEGVISLRQTSNPKIRTGEVELIGDHFELLSEAKVPPFAISDTNIEPSEDLRLTYRYLDMRRGKILETLRLRHSVMQSARATLSANGFTEVSTPMLTKATPEGSRDYLVPSRIYQGLFYALPQSPQMFKQLLMIGGLDRYFQIATCCRDEDLRADRQPEFHQIDIEMSFGTIEDLFPIAEQILTTIVKDTLGILLQKPFPRLTYTHCMETYGTDKPDLRFGMPLIDCADLAEKTTFEPFITTVKTGGIVKGLTIPGGALFSRKQLEVYQHLASSLGFQGLAYIKNSEDGLQGPIAKYIKEEDVLEWKKRYVLQEKDAIFILAGEKKKTLQALDQLRRKLGRDLNCIDENSYVPLWVIDFPLFSWNEDEKKLESENHPFTSPHFDDISRLEIDPLSVRSYGYDLVLNGYEISSGSQRIHDGHLQKKIFDLLGYTEEEIHSRFGFFIEALQYGTPPHLGMALGVDRIVMILSKTDNIRDVVAFPKNQKGYDLMTKAPSDVPESQLQDLGIKKIS